MAIPSPLDADYVVARSHDVRSWSFGNVTAPRNPSSTIDDHVRGTLHDQGIFGPVRDFHCVCGRYVGIRYKGMICDRCGVKLALKSSRATRFGHIELPNSIPHPFSDDQMLECFPVVPALLMQSPGGEGLPDLYDRLIVAAERKPSTHWAEIIKSIMSELLPIAVLLHQWQLDSAIVLTRGLALERKNTDESSPRFCLVCGYLVAGLAVSACPGCGNPIP